jgi:UDP-N-acetylmuramoyl-tripeptide--D-alanyl-D-alanine ligase
VLELGIDHLGEARELTDLVQPTHTVLTLIAEAHLDGLGDLRSVAREKGRILSAGSVRRYASAGAAALLPPDFATGVTSYGLDRPQPPTGRYRPSPDGGALEAHLATDTTVQVRLPGLGRALAEHALVALLVARDLGIDPELAATRMSEATIEPRRLQPHRLGSLLLIDDSYNASPASMALALEVLAGLPRPHAAVLGDMLELGDEAPRRHRELGERTAGLDLIWAVGAHANDLAAGNSAVRTFPDAASAVADAHTLPTSGTLLVKGSRGVALDRLVDALLTARMEAAP